MNCEEIKQKVSIRAVLESYGLFPANPAKDNKRTAFYFALDRDERTASLSVNFIKNTAFDFGTGKSYDIISIVQAMNRCSVSDALEYLKKFDFSDVLRDTDKTDDHPPHKILNISEVRHPALIQYLKSRKVFEFKSLVKEIHYSIKSRNYFGIGFFNNSQGIEVRSKYLKTCIGSKDLTWSKSPNERNSEIAIFEGFFDYLSYLAVVKEISNSDTDFLVLNSTSMIFASEKILGQYEKISLFLDNDATGKATVEKFRQKYENVEDCSLLYKDFNDLNEWLCR